MRILPILTTDVARFFPLAEPLLAAGFEYSQGDYNTDNAKVYLSNGQWQLLIAADKDTNVVGAATVEYFNRPNDRVAFFTCVGGKFLTTPEVFAQVRDILKYNGATKIEGAARESAARLWKSKFGFEEKYKIVEVSL